LLVIAALAAPFAFAARAEAASGDLAWQRAYNGTGDDDDFWAGVARAPKGGAYVAGSVRPDAGAGVVNYDFAVARYAAGGTRRWLRTFDGPAGHHDIAMNVASDRFGNVVVVGYVNYLALQPQIAAVVKYDAQGKRRWARFYDAPNGSSEIAGEVAIDAAGNVYVAGEYSTPGSDTDAFLARYSPSGARKWVRSYSGPGQDQIRDIAVDDRGNVYLTGVTYTSAMDFDMLTLKYRPDGKRSWVRRLDGPASSTDMGNAIAVTGGGTVYVAGQVVDTTTGVDAALVKYSTAGAFKWLSTRSSIGASNDHYLDVALLGNGDVVAAGDIDAGPLTEDTDLLLARLSHAGGTRWARIYDGPDALDDGGEYVATLGGDIYVAGFATSTATARDILTLKYGGSGQFRWARSHGGVDMSNDFAAGILAVSGSVYTAGKRGATTGNDGILLRYRP
jgi:hypothetical protein